MSHDEGFTGISEVLKHTHSHNFVLLKELSLANKPNKCSSSILIDDFEQACIELKSVYIM